MVNYGLLELTINARASSYLVTSVLSHSVLVLEDKTLKIIHYLHAFTRFSERLVTLCF